MIKRHHIRTCLGRLCVCAAVVAGTVISAATADSNTRASGAAFSAAIVGLSLSKAERYTMLRRTLPISKKDWHLLSLTVMTWEKGYYANLPLRQRLLEKETLQKDFGPGLAEIIERIEESEVFHPLIERLSLLLLRSPTPLTLDQANKILDSLYTLSRKKLGECSLKILNLDEISALPEQILTSKQMPAFSEAVMQVRSQIRS